jgi:hypothetical protein
MPTWEEKPDPTVDSIRKELRGAIFDCAFWTTGFDIEGRKEEAEIGRQKACAFVVFGVNMKLFTPIEGNDWLDVIWDRNPDLSLADVSKKYMDNNEPPTVRIEPVTQ